MSEILHPGPVRTYDEMHAMYKQREAEGVETPYVVEAHKGSRHLIFIGSDHVGDPNHPHIAYITQRWHEFIQTEGPKLVLVEGFSSGVPAFSEEKVYENFVESVYTAWLAQQADIAIISPEPDMAEELQGLQAQGVRREDMMTYYFGRQMDQWHRLESPRFPDWRAYAERWLRKDVAAGLIGYGDLEEVLAAYQLSQGVQFDIDDTQRLEKLSDPYTSAPARASCRIRDTQIIQTLTEAWRNGTDTFTVYGSGHAIILEPVLRNIERST